MVTNDEILSAVGRLRQRLETSLPIERAILFGSRARGDSRPDSDVDLIVVSAGYRGMRAGQRMYRTRKAWDLPVAVDFLCFTPEEFGELAAKTSIVSLAVAEGEEIAAV